MRCALDDNESSQGPGDPTWVTFEAIHPPDSSQCRHGDHLWVAFFFEKGSLAYWQCAGCGHASRVLNLQPSLFPNRLEVDSGWIESPPRLIARGAKPPSGRRRWTTMAGLILSEGDPSSIHFVGQLIPDLDQAHTYLLSDQNGGLEAVYEPQRERLGLYSDHYWLTRYQVVADALVRFESHCFEDSTYEIPNTSEPKRSKVLKGLVPQSD